MRLQPTKGQCVSALALAAMGGGTMIPDTAAATDNCTIAASNIPRGHVVVDVETGSVLSSSGNLNARFHLASLTKIMANYVILEAFEQGLLNPNQMITIRGSEQGDADRAMLGRSMTIQDGLNASAGSPNAFYETVAAIYPGGVNAFRQAMNRNARLMGADHTNFANVNGLNLWGSFGCANHYTTPIDLFRIYDHAYDRFPNQFHSFFGNSTINTNGRTDTIYPTSALQRRQDDIRIAYNIEIDEIKTGYIRFSGAHLFASARVNGRRVYVLQIGDNRGDCAIDPSFRIRDCNVLNHLLAIDGRRMTSRVPNFNTASNPIIRETATETGAVRMTWTGVPVSVRPANSEILPPISPVRLPTRIDENTLRYWDGRIVPENPSPTVSNARPAAAAVPISSLAAPRPIS